MLRMIEPLLTSCQKGPSPLHGRSDRGWGTRTRAPSFFSSFGVGKHRRRRGRKGNREGSRRWVSVEILGRLILLLWLSQNGGDER